MIRFTGVFYTVPPTISTPHCTLLVVDVRVRLACMFGPIGEQINIEHRGNDKQRSKNYHWNETFLLDKRGRIESEHFCFCWNCLYDTE